MTDVLKSKRFISAVIGILAMLLVAAIPELQSAEPELISSFTVIVVLLIGGYTFEGAIQAWLARPGSVDKVGVALQYLIDKVESALKVDIPDDMEAAGVREAKEALADYAKKAHFSVENKLDPKVNEDWLKDIK